MMNRSSSRRLRHLPPSYRPAKWVHGKSGRSRLNRLIPTLLPLEERALLSNVFDVTTINDSGAGSLRQAMLDANTTANAADGPDVIRFSIGSGLKSIRPLSPLPSLTDSVTIDATTQPGYAGDPLIELDGTNLSGYSGLTLAAGNCTIKGLVINRFYFGIQVGGSGGSLIAGNYIGTDASGNPATGSPSHYGVYVYSPNNMIGGTGSGAGNLISGNFYYGVYLNDSVSNGTMVQGNKIGSNAAGTAGLGGQSDGIYAYATNATIGGAVAGAGNLISGNSSYGLVLDHCNGQVVQGNTIGPNAAGTSSLGGQFYGIDAYSTTNLTIGGTASGAGNLISGNSSNGVYLSGSSGVVMQGNTIGPNAAGTASLGGQITGVTASSMTGITIGGTASGAGNLVSGNSSFGLDAEYGSGMVIQGNRIGTNATGSAGLGMQLYGVQASSTTNLAIGGTAVGAGNLVSGNSYVGVYLPGIDGAAIQGNTIGPNAAGTAALVGQSYGIFTNTATNVTIGGAGSGAGNLISGNSIAGVYANSGSGIVVQGNKIGPNAAGTAGLGGQSNGVYAYQTSATIGGTSAGAGNVIAFNSRNGVTVPSFAAVAIRRNAIFSNGSLGIDLGDNGVTANDAGDADSGPNNLQNYPMITGATIQAGTMTIAGSLNSTPNSTFTIELFSNTAPNSSGYGEGQVYLGTFTVTTNALGNASFSVPVTAPAVPHPYLTATATDSAGNTSEFSLALRENSVPIAATYFTTLLEDGAVNIPVLANDSDPDGDALFVTGATQGIHGATAIFGNSIRYAPAQDFNGSDFFSYSISDGLGGAATAFVQVTVLPVNDAPTFAPGGPIIVDEDSGTYSAVWATNVSAGPANETGQLVNFEIVGDSNPSLFASAPSFSSTGVLNFFPATDANGVASISVRLRDNGGTINGGVDSSSPSSFMITVRSVNDQPIANDDSATTDEDQPVVIPVLANDRPGPASAVDESVQTLVITHLNGQAVNPGSSVSTAQGTVTLNADGTVTYTPIPDYNGPDSFSYTIRDDGVPPESASASGFVTINPVNDAPILVTTSQSFPAINEDDVSNAGTGVAQFLASLTITDVDAGAASGLAITGVDNTQGTWQFSTNDGAGWTAFGSPADSAAQLLADVPSNRIRFVPSADFFGLATFSFRAWDQTFGADGGVADVSSHGGITAYSAATGTATITVLPVNDPPVAGDDAYTTDEDTPLVVLPAQGLLNNDSDVDHDLLTARITIGPAAGVVTLNDDGSFTFDPQGAFDYLAVGHSQQVSFSYVANDGTADSNPATVTITVTGVNDTPFFKGIGLKPIFEDTSQDIGISATDPDGDSLTYSILSGPSHGTLSISPGKGLKYTYTPDPDFFGDDQITFEASDPYGGTGTVTVTIPVAEVNDAPVAVDDTIVTAEDTPFQGSVLANDYDPDNTDGIPGNEDTLSAELGAGPVHGSLALGSDGTFTYSPDHNYSGSDTFSYTVSDGRGGSATATVNLTVLAVADNPIVTASSPGGVEGSPIPVVISPSLTDTDGSEFIHSIRVRGVPSGAMFNHGTFVETFEGNDVWSFTPDELSGLILTVPDGPAAVVLTVTAFSRETSNMSTAESSVPLAFQVDNVNPSASISNNGPLTYGSASIVSFSNQHDPSASDSTTGFHYAFSENAANLLTASYANSGSTPSQSYDFNAGSHTIYARIIDKDDGYSEYQTTVTVAKADAVIVVNGYGVTYDGQVHLAIGTATGSLSESLAGLPTLAELPTPTPATIPLTPGPLPTSAATITVPVAPYTTSSRSATCTLPPMREQQDLRPDGRRNRHDQRRAGQRRHHPALQQPRRCCHRTGRHRQLSHHRQPDRPGNKLGNYTVHATDAALTAYKADAAVTVNGYSGTYDASPHGATGTVVGVAGDLSAAGSSLNLGFSFTDA